MPEATPCDTQVTTVFTGTSPDRLVCDTTLRALPDGSWGLFFLGGGDTEPSPANRIFCCRSPDRGRSWSAPAEVDLGVKRTDATPALVPTELMVIDGRCTLWVATHRGGFRGWRTWYSDSTDSGRIHENSRNENIPRAAWRTRACGGERTLQR